VGDGDGSCTGRISMHAWFDMLGRCRLEGFFVPLEIDDDDMGPKGFLNSFSGCLIGAGGMGRVDIIKLRYN